MPNVSLRELVTCLPTNNAQLRHISGIGKARLRRYRKEISGLIRKYCEEQHFADPPTATPARPPCRTLETQRHSFELFRASGSLDEIAAERGLTRGTIEGPLSHFIGLGDLDINAVLARETVDALQQIGTRPVTVARVGAGRLAESGPSHA